MRLTHRYSSQSLGIKIYFVSEKYLYKRKVLLQAIFITEVPCIGTKKVTMYLKGASHNFWS